MKKIIIFVVFLIGCSEEHETDKKICSPFRMTISDAIPIQFWVNGVETYNQKEVCGITPVCFCQPFNCDDEIRIQFQDDIQSSILLITTDGGEEFSLNFSKINNTTFELSFIPSELGLCDEQIRMDITDGVDKIIAPNLWGNTYSANSMTKSATQFTQAVVTGTNWGNDQPLPTQVALGGVVSFDVIIGITGVWTGSVNIVFRIVRNGGIESAIQSINLTANQSPTVHHIILTKNFSQIDPEDLWLAVDGTASGTANVTITMPVGDIIYTGEILASSDCIDLNGDHDCTQLIRYTNSKDYAGIEYTDFSPNAYFYIRVPAVFFHETNPTEEERFETSGQTIVRLRDEIKIKRNLQLGYMPDYMHRKLLLILAHDTVEIDGDTWVRNDPYEKVPPANKRYPLKMANVLLTLQGYIKRNIL